MLKSHQGHSEPYLNSSEQLDLLVPAEFAVDEFRIERRIRRRPQPDLIIEATSASAKSLCTSGRTRSGYRHRSWTPGCRLSVSPTT